MEDDVVSINDIKVSSSSSPVRLPEGPSTSFPQCPHCFKTFKSQGGLAYHVSMFAGRCAPVVTPLKSSYDTSRMEDDVVSINDIKVSSSSSPVRLLEGPSTSFPQCPHCFKTFKSQSGLAYHVSQAVCMQRQKRQKRQVLSKKEMKRASSAHEKAYHVSQAVSMQRQKRPPPVDDDENAQDVRQASNFITVISDPKPLDILCERGGKSNCHPGNSMYRSMGRALVPLVKESNSLDSRSRCR
ncbi:hypothetical protein TrCOL_g10337 [Triparma columacea]|uniref:C2H2-type domain-containing protein n=1 Tax=Triparma columacea TaxID=722753 RepID=A0A9W7L7G2_9STRA|nr:hypothetical protein TrCOL_g10337 [Triparma columacea]